VFSQKVALPKICRGLLPSLLSSLLIVVECLLAKASAHRLVFALGPKGIVCNYLISKVSAHIDTIYHHEFRVHGNERRQYSTEMPTTPFFIEMKRPRSGMFISGGEASTWPQIILNIIKISQ
jgi:hypothetical protein